MKNSQRIYCVEDDLNIQELISYSLTQSGFFVECCSSGNEFFDKLSKEKPDLVILDIMLPDIDGMQILKRIRTIPACKNIPVIMLSAKSGQLDKIKGLDAGADDYITKPFDVLELISRIKANLRRTSATEDVTIYKNIKIEKGKRIVEVDGKVVNLTYKEFELLCMFIDNSNIVLTRDNIMNNVWGTDFEGETRTVDVHIRTLRQKLGSAGGYIETVRNVGYRIV